MSYLAVSKRSCRQACFDALSARERVLPRTEILRGGGRDGVGLLKKPKAAARWGAGGGGDVEVGGEGEEGGGSRLYPLYTAPELIRAAHPTGFEID